ncbi:hypothetical protein ACHAXH_000341, partial [Discostella pseudostelligera]
MIVRYAIVIMLMSILPNAHCEHLRGPDKEEMNIDRPLQEKWTPTQKRQYQRDRHLQYGPYYYDDYAYQRDRRRRYDTYNRQYGDDGYIQEKW